MTVRDIARAVTTRLIRPVWRRAWARIETRLLTPERRLAETEGRLAETERRLAGMANTIAPLQARLDEWLPVILSTTTAVGKMSRESASAISRCDALAARIAESEQASHQSADSLKAWLAARLDQTEGHLDTKLALDQQSLAQLGARLDQTENRVGTRLTEDQHALAQFQNTTRQLWERIDFIRKEILLEIQYGSNPTSTKSEKKAEPKIVNPSKIEQMAASGLRLNLGCGHIPIDQYINVDQRELPGVDVVAGVEDIPFEPGTVSEVYSAHLIEHFPQEHFRRRLLPYWRSLLTEHGILHVVAPDGEAMLDGIAKRTYAFSDFREVLFGGQDYDGDFHYNMFTPDSLAQLLAEAGFEDITCVEKGRRNGACFEFEMSAKRGNDNRAPAEMDLMK